MIDTRRQVPSPSAAAWRIDAGRIGGPAFVVMRLGEDGAREALAHHLVAIGKFSEAAKARRAIGPLPAESVSVIW